MNKVMEAVYRRRGGDGKSFRQHHEFSIELIQMLSSGGHFMVRNELIPIEAGNVLIVNGIESHCSNPSDLRVYTRSKIIIHYNHFQNLSQVFDWQDICDMLMEDGFLRYPVRTNMPIFSEIDHCFSEAAGLFLGGAAEAQAGITLQVARMLMSLRRVNNLPIGKNNPDGEGLADQMLEYIDDKVNNGKVFKLDEFCAYFFISQSYACHYFKKNVGVSVMSYVSNLRVSRAKKMLMQSDMRVQQISDQLGYSSSTAFCKAFQNATGESPLVFRKKSREMMLEERVGFSERRKKK